LSSSAGGGKGSTKKNHEGAVPVEEGRRRALKGKLKHALLKPLKGTLRKKG